MSQKAKSKRGPKLSLILELLFENTAPAKRKLDGVSSRSTIGELKTRIEQDVGLLPEMYALTYLDAMPLEDSVPLRDHYVVSGATLVARIWRIWQDLANYAYIGNVAKTLASADVTSSSDWSGHCAWSALYIAAHRGHHILVAELLQSTGAAVNAQSPSGWTALHAAARSGKWKVLCILLDQGADVRIKDDRDHTAFNLARHYRHKQCENSLNFCQWNLQKHFIIQEREKTRNVELSRRMAERRAHLAQDSALTTWLHGYQGQIYMVHIGNPVTVDDVARYKRGKLEEAAVQETVQLPSIKIQRTTSYPDTRSPTPVVPGRGSKLESYEEEIEDGEKLDFDYGWFDSTRAQALIPHTQDILNYANPSSAKLRPRSLLNPEGYSLPLTLFPPPPTIPDKAR